jgi:two-component sensor histidine kinase
MAITRLAALARNYTIMTTLPTPHSLPSLASSDRVAKPTGFRDTWVWSALKWGGIWFAACLIFVSQNALRPIVRGQPVDWFIAFWVEVLYWIPWFVLTPLLLGAARRWPLGSGAPRSNLAWHLVFMVGFSLVQVAASDALQFWAGVSHGVFTQPNRVELAVANYTRAFPALAITAWWKYWVFMGCRYAFDYHRRFREREVAAAQLETQLATAQLQALRMQLHPHFLFNALHSAAMLTMIDPEGAHKVLVQLSALLRTTLDRSSSAEVPLSEEIDFVDRYLAIERVRFQDRLRVEIEADDDALAASVPNLILQPLVENAVRHGIARRTDSGALTIRAARTNGALVLEVEDDGEGLPNAWTLSPPHGTGVGLTNVRSRLERIYGDKARLELLTPADTSGKPTRGTLARITMPYKKLSAISHQPSAQTAGYEVRR